MHLILFLIGFLLFITRRCSASYSHGESNGGSQMESQGTPMFVHMHTPVMYSAPLMAAAPFSSAGQYDMNSPNSGAGNLMGSYGGGQGHHSRILIELPFRRARARKMAARRAARMRKNLKKHHKVNKH